MLEEAQLEPGQRVLDVGSGSGDMALLAAQAVGASGFVLATDVHRDRMAGLAARIAASAPPPALAILESPAEELTLEPGSFDVALARNCVMYFRDLGSALLNVRRALRPGGRFVASVYGPLASEPFHRIPIEAVERRQALPEQAPGYVQAFRVGADDVRTALARAGFADVRTRVLPVARTYANLAAALETMRMSTSLGELMSALPAGQREDAWADIECGFRGFEAAAGLRIPGEQVILIGTA
jgi:ubiquinone/menaquinone biosynthesis C-methylase UbiE